MYLKSIRITNFRKFGTEDNIVRFIDGESYQEVNLKDINVAPTTTLIIGKNNSGKTTIIEALDKLINKNSFDVNDFNLLYLGKLLEAYTSTQETIRCPFMEFDICIGIDKGSTDLITNLIPLMTLEDVDEAQLEVKAKYELLDEEVFKSSIRKLCKEKYSKSLMTSKFIEIISESKFSIKYYNKNGENIHDFKLQNLMELKPIKANNIQGDKCLSKAFNKIIEYRYNEVLGDKKALEATIIGMNEQLTETINQTYTENINGSLGRVISSDKLQVLLRADLTFRSLMNNLLKYQYVEGEVHIPENQFGLGYTNLVMIIAELIDYMEKYPNKSFNSKVNLISIEEPETFMHPQMQELFIKNINDAIKTLLESKGKKINSQLIITTHSSHILNSKIHSGNTFNNINYIISSRNCAKVINLSDDKILPNTDKKDNDLKFLKKHIKYKVSELFFSDAVILVEGITEYTLLPYYIDQDERLNKYYISVFNINGAHGLVYNELIKLLKVPTLIITDLDIKRSKKEKGEDEEKNFKQVTDLDKRITTNQTIIKHSLYNEKLDNIEEYIKDNNICVLYQGKINGYYATSFEEAFILTNYNNVLLNSVLKKMKPDIYKEIVTKWNFINNNLNNKLNSYKWQCKLSKSKSDFANELLYSFIIEDNKTKIPLLPTYIKNGMDILANELMGDESK